MTTYGSTLPLWPELGHIAEPRKPRLAGWWTKRPGWWREEAARASERLTDHQFLARQCHHKYEGRHSQCYGWSQQGLARMKTKRSYSPLWPLLGWLAFVVLAWPR